MLVEKKKYFCSVAGEATVHLSLAAIVLANAAPLAIIRVPRLRTICKAHRISINAASLNLQSKGQLAGQADVGARLADTTDLVLVRIVEGCNLKRVPILCRVGLLVLNDVHATPARSIALLVVGSIGVEATSTLSDLGDTALPLLETRCRYIAVPHSGMVAARFEG